MFENEVTDCIRQYNTEVEILNETGTGCRTLLIRSKNLAFHLLPVPFAGLQELSPSFFQVQSLEYAHQGIHLVHLWQDCWHTKKEIVRSRIAVLSGSCVRIHARRTEVRRIAKDVMFDFFAINHLQGFVNGRYNYGLYIDEQLIAAASFSVGRKIMRNDCVCRSFELLRFANLLHHRVTGGLGKLIARFVKDIKPDDIMTYADLDWASGNGYRTLKFKQIAITPPKTFWIHPAEMIRYSPNRLPQQLTDEYHKFSQHGNMDDFLKNMGYINIYNSGNLKFLLI